MLEYGLSGNLEPGIYEMGWDDFKITFGFNAHRQVLIKGLELAIFELKAVGCKAVYIDGSFVTKKIYPGDFDMCWDEKDVNYELMNSSYPGLTDFGFKMKNMKKRYGGDIVPMTNYANSRGTGFLVYFQEDRQGKEKGIIRISLI
ncbi:MAG TPA: hypothetical protein VNS58_23480 [Puia sp.]|nr:hypothetical protein [Puia sp.]